MPLVYTIQEGPKIRARPLPGQGIDYRKNVQCPRDIRNSSPVGTIFYCDILRDSTDRSFLTARGDMHAASNYELQEWWDEVDDQKGVHAMFLGKILDPRANTIFNGKKLEGVKKKKESFEVNIHEILGD